MEKSTDSDKKGEENNIEEDPEKDETQEEREILVIMEKSIDPHKKEREKSSEEDPLKDEVQKEREILKKIYDRAKLKNLISLNSADDVRQAQRHGHSGIRINDVEENNVQSRNDGDHNEGKAMAVPKNKNKEKNNTDKRHQRSLSKSEEQSKLRNMVKKVPKKRPGRPPKAGPSRKAKKRRVNQNRKPQQLVAIFSSSSSLFSFSSG